MRRIATLLPLMFVCLGLPMGAQQAPPAQAPPAQQPQPTLTFRATTNLVEVDAIVTDATGGFVRDLRKDEFEILEDGNGVFSIVDIPIDRPDPLLHRSTAVDADVVTNERPFDGRVFMIVLDAFHIAPIRSSAVRQQARTFVERFMGVNDLAAVIHVGRPEAGQEFTTNRRLLLEAIERFSGQAMRSATENMIRDARHKASMLSDGTSGGPAILDMGPAEDVQARERAFMARESANALKRLSDYMIGLSGRRKAVLFFSEGIDYQTIDAPGLVSALPTAERVLDEAGSVRVSQTSMIAAATRANVSIYTIDPRGLATEGDETIALGMLPGQTGDIVGARDYQVSSPQTDLGVEIKVAQDSLRYFADETGGLAFVNSNDADAAFRRILEDNSSYYLIGYVSPDSRRDGRYHRVSIRVNRPGVRVRARKGYYAPNHTAPRTTPVDSLQEMLASPTPLTGLRMRATAGVVRSPDNTGRVRLTVEFHGEDVALETRGERFANDIDIGYEALDMSGKPRAWGRHLMHLKLKPETRAAFPAHGARYVTEFDLDPGRYQLRLAAREQVGGKGGSIFYDIDVPPFAMLPISMSDLLLASAVANRTVTGRGAPSLGWRLPGQTTTVREFDRRDTITLYAGIYDSDPRPHSLDVTVTVTADNGAQVFRTEATRTSEELAGQKGEFPYTVNIPLLSVAPGRYVLAVNARSRLGDSVRKEIEFRVR
jgi:VWFA-related protein